MLRGLWRATREGGLGKRCIAPLVPPPSPAEAVTPCLPQRRGPRIVHGVSAEDLGQAVTAERLAVALMRKDAPGSAHSYSAQKDSGRTNELATSRPPPRVRIPNCACEDVRIISTDCRCRLRGKRG